MKEEENWKYGKRAIEEKAAWIERKKAGRRMKEKGFWNMAGIRNRCSEAWEYMEKFDIIGCTETWIEEKEWQK